MFNLTTFTFIFKKKINTYNSRITFKVIFVSQNFQDKTFFYIFKKNFGIHETKFENMQKKIKIKNNYKNRILKTIIQKV